MPAADPLATPGPPRNRRSLPIARVATVIVSAALIALLLYGVQAQSPDLTIGEGIARGEAVDAPSFDLDLLQAGEPGPRLNGLMSRAAADGSVALDELRGTPIVLNFWASWCGPCKDEAPALDRAWRRAQRDGVLVLGINVQDSRSNARDFLRRFDVPYPSLRDTGPKVTRAYGVTGLPETLFIDGGGRVVGQVVGIVDDAALTDGIAAAASGRVVQQLGRK